jgi:hypothetical protein
MFQKKNHFGVDFAHMQNDEILKNTGICFGILANKYRDNR